MAQLGVAYTHRAEFQGTAALAALDRRRARFPVRERRRRALYRAIGRSSECFRTGKAQNERMFFRFAYF